MEPIRKDWTQRMRADSCLRSPGALDGSSIREVETHTVVNLLPNVTDEGLKSAVASELWPRN